MNGLPFIRNVSGCYADSKSATPLEQIKIEGFYWRGAKSLLRNRIRARSFQLMRAPRYAKV